MKINTEATRDKCREKYGSVAACYRAYEVSPRLFYATTAGIRGVTERDGVSKRILDRLRSEGLLVEKEVQ